MRIQATALLLIMLAVSGLAHAGEEPVSDVREDAGSGEDIVSFTNDVMPLLSTAGCNAIACHGAQQGKGGLKLSMFAAEPADDYVALAKAAEGRRVNRVEPTKSLLLQKTTGGIPHQGGKKIEVGSEQYGLLAAWIAQGARGINPEEPTLVEIRVTPGSATLEKDAIGQLAVMAVSSDGSERDVTDNSQYESVQPTIATVDQNGQIKAAGFGQATIIVSHLRQFATVQVIVPQPLSDPFPEFPANNKIDGLVVAKLKQLGIPPSELCSDEQFVRRVYLDVIGTLPTADQARTFLADADPQKRSKLIDQLLECDEFADFWALKWGDLFRLKSEYPSNLWPNAVQAYHHWIRDSIAKNKPYDQFARELITASGSNFRVPPANYYRAFLKRDPQNLGEVTALIFMGARIGCARCHAHPTESWSVDDNMRLAAFFGKVSFKRTQEWKEEIVFINPKLALRHPTTRAVIPMQAPGAEVVEVGATEDPRVKFADWLTAPDNPWFARNIANRTWFWLLGRGIVHEVDDLRSTNPPQNPELLAFLEGELRSHKYDLKHIYRLILNSRTYQLSSKTNELNAGDVANFSHYQTKRLGAETLLDAIGQVTEKWDAYQSRIPEPFVKLPVGFRATHLTDGSIDLPFLQLFGRPPRDTAFESDRDLKLSMRQTLHLLNSSDVQNKINASPRLKRLLMEHKDDAQLLEEVFFAVLSRAATEAEGKATLEYLSGNKGAARAQAQAEKKAAEEALTKVKGELEKVKADHAAAEKAANDAEAAAAATKAAAAQVATVLADAQKAADAKRQQASEAKKKLDDLVHNQQKSAEAKLAAADKLVGDGTTAKAASDQPLAEAQTAAAQAQQAYDAAEKAAQEAEAAAKAISEDADKPEEKKKQAVAEAAAKRQVADEAKTALAQAEQRQQQAQSQVDVAAQRLTETQSQKTAAQDVLANVKSQMAAATEASQATEKAVQEAAAVAMAAKAEADKAPAVQTAAKKAAAEKRKLADQTKARRDRLAADEKAANAKLAEANKKVAAAGAPRSAAQRQRALQDVLWALLNTKEFLFNH